MLMLFVTRDQKALLIVRVNDIEAAIKTLEEEYSSFIDMKELEKIQFSMVTGFSGKKLFGEEP